MKLKASIIALGIAIFASLLASDPGAGAEPRAISTAKGQEAVAVTGAGGKDVSAIDPTTTAAIDAVMDELRTETDASAPNAAQETPVTASGARVAGDAQRTRFIIDLSRSLSFSTSALASPDRVIIDMPEVSFQLPPEAGKNGRGLVKAWRYGLIAPGKSRIVLDLSAPARLDKSFVLPAIDEQPARLVLDFVKTTREAFLSEYERPRSLETAAPKGDRKDVGPDSRTRPIIVLDPGHGGIDTGATGVDGIHEKVVVLEFAKLLKKKLEEKGAYEVLMTRDDDRFIPLAKRVEFARHGAADLFISIHADSAPQHHVRGATVYTLSERASDVIAAALATRENSSDILAGADLEDEPDDVADILIDLARRETKSFSILFAKTLVSEFESAVKLIKNPWRSAGFRVLKAYDVPSVLVELGYLSNKHDESLLMSGEWRERAADALVASVDRFFQPRMAQGR
ncbi:N-acetylmuramoyl-L-alanine amidase [Breoghania sp.]|uniref:N-acetylmuramoyl-L-alanine amidase n=1 Tax=Breoghania sp. TaxID=2065378 RepID=UPI002AAB2A99|nr:N-acetylmuramoyl-L-alanine amidase [Breoghania sp.]